MTPEQDVERGRRARELLDDDLLGEALDAIEAEVIKQWGDCPARDKDGKELLWQLYKTSQKFRGLLGGYVETGKLSAQNLGRPLGKQSLLARLKAA